MFHITLLGKLSVESKQPVAKTYPMTAFMPIYADANKIFCTI